MEIPKALFNIDGYFAEVLTIEDNVEDLQKLCENCSCYYKLMEGKKVSPNAGKEVFYDLPKGKKLQDKIIIGIYTKSNKLIGIIDMIKDFPVDKIWFIGLMMLDPAERKKGLGEKMVKEYIKFASKNEIGKIRLGVLKENDGALKFWDRMGFKITREISNYKINKKTTTVYAMEYENKE